MYDGVGQKQPLVFDRSRARSNPSQERDRRRRVARVGHEFVHETESLCNGTYIARGRSWSNVEGHAETDIAAIARRLIRTDVVGPEHAAILSIARGQRFVCRRIVDATTAGATASGALIGGRCRVRTV